jgi:hypothetical protein
VSGDTVQLYIKEGSVFTDAALGFDDTDSKHDGIDFIFSTEVSGDKWSIGDGSAFSDYFQITNVTTGSLTLIDAICANDNTRYLFDPDSNKGYDIVLIDCEINLTNDFSRFFSQGGVGINSDITITNTTIMTSEQTFISPSGNTIIKDSNITVAGNGAGRDTHIFIIGQDAESIEIINSTLVAEVFVSRGISVAVEATIGHITIIDSDIFTDGYGLKLIGTVSNLLVQNTPIESLSETPIEADGEITNAVIIGNTLTCTDPSSFVIHLQHACPYYKISNNRINGTQHVLFIQGSEEDSGEVSFNVVVASAAPAMAIFGSNINVHHNTAIANGGTTCVIGAAGGEIPSVLATVRLKINNNIFVNTDGVAFYDYDASDGLDGGRGVNDAMTDYVDTNCYWRVENFSTGAVQLGEVGSEQRCDTIPKVLTAWNTATSDGSKWNINFASVNDINSLIEDPQLDSNFIPHNHNVTNAGMGAILPPLKFNANIGSTNIQGKI